MKKPIIAPSKLRTIETLISSKAVANDAAKKIQLSM